MNEPIYSTGSTRWDCTCPPTTTRRGDPPATSARHHRMRAIPLTLLAACTLALPACSSEKPAAAPTVTVTAATPTSSPSASHPLQLGQTHTTTFSNWALRVTVYAYRQPLRSDFPPQVHGNTYAGADVRFCNVRSDKTVTVSWQPWSLEFNDDTLVGSADEWSPDWFSVPLYPAVDKTVPVGRCVRGWVLFSVPVSKRPAFIAYTTSDENGAPLPTTEWSVR